MKVCAHCFNDIELQQFININSTEKGNCDCCGLNDIYTLELTEIADFFSEFLSIFKKAETGNILYELIQKDWNLFSNQTACEKIINFFIYTFYPQFINANQVVVYKENIDECISFWEILKDDLKWKRRFLTDTEKIFDLGWDGFFGNQISLSNADVFYRARLHLNDEKTPFSNAEMGCPPNIKTTSGRANPQGIPFLYLSKDLETTFYETRSIYLDDVSVGKFQIKQNESLVIVDFTEDGSPFSNIENINEFAKSKLLKKYISADLSKPIRRNDSELEYIPTQFICEFIRYITGADGILFNSSLHKGGKNIVLFNQEKVECIDVKMYRISNIEISSEIL